MRKAVFPLPFFLLLALVLLVVPVRAEDDVSLTDFPSHLAQQLGIDVFAGRILASIIFMSLFLLPTLLLTRHIIAPLLVGGGCLAFCTAIGWFPLYVFAIIAVVIGFNFTSLVGKHL